MKVDVLERRGGEGREGRRVENPPSGGGRGIAEVGGRLFALFCL
jgi:hypothetical protein